MTWLQQLLLALSATATIGSASAGPCGDVAHVPDAGVAYQPEAGVEMPSALAVDPAQLDIPVVADVLRRPGRAGPVTGETLIGIATTDGRNVTFQGPAVNEGQTLTLGPDCAPLELKAR